MISIPVGPPRIPCLWLFGVDHPLKMVELECESWISSRAEICWEVQFCLSFVEFYEESHPPIDIEWWAMKCVDYVWNTKSDIQVSLVNALKWSLWAWYSMNLTDSLLNVEGSRKKSEVKCTLHQFLSSRMYLGSENEVVHFWSNFYFVINQKFHPFLHLLSW